MLQKILSLFCLMSSFHAAEAVPTYALALHGGAGAIPKDLDAGVRSRYERSLTEALQAGEALLREGASAVDVVEAVVRRLEDDPKFNAGRGSVLNSVGVVEMDASIMDGRTLACGSVIGISLAKNPVSVARKVMEESECVMLHTAGADTFAAKQGCEIETTEYFVLPERIEQLKRCKALGVIDLDHQEPQDQKFGTVGCVALDTKGNVAAATSTGGLVNKREGRVGDTPIVGAGTYADNESCAVSCTGRGEEFVRRAVAHEIAAALKYGSESLDQVVERVLSQRLPPNTGGVIAISHRGEIITRCNTLGMYRASVRAGSDPVVQIWD